VSTTQSTRSDVDSSSPPTESAAASVLPDWRKTCPCCGASYTWEGWCALPKVGQAWGATDERGRVLNFCESRNCPCGSTQSVDLLDVVDTLQRTETQ
jgi:hypothetical protein